MKVCSKLSFNTEPLKYNDNHPPKDKNNGVLAFALEKYAKLLTIIKLF